MSKGYKTGTSTSKMSEKLETISINRTNDQIKEPSGHCRKSERINQAEPQQPERPAFVAKSK